MFIFAKVDKMYDTSKSTNKKNKLFYYFSPKEKLLASYLKPGV